MVSIYMTNKNEGNWIERNFSYIQTIMMEMKTKKNTRRNESYFIKALGIFSEKDRLLLLRTAI